MAASGTDSIHVESVERSQVSPPFPGIVYECRPFCLLPERDQVFFYECVGRKGRAAGHVASFVRRLSGGGACSGLK